MANGPIIQGKDGLLEWSAPIDYGSVAFSGAGHYPNAGTFYGDASARKANGTLVNGPTWQWVPELGRWGILCNGTTQYGFADPPARVYPYFFAAWMRADTIAASYFLSNPTNNTFRNQNIGIQSDAGTLKIALLHVGNLADFTVFGPEPVLNRWYHVAASMLAGNLSYLYVDGALAATQSGNAGSLGTVTTLGIGAGLRGSTAPNNYFHGIVADPLLIPGILSPPQIAWLANRANNPWQPWRRKWWPVSGTPVGATIKWPWQIRRQRRTAGAR